MEWILIRWPTLPLRPLIFTAFLDRTQKPPGTELTPKHNYQEYFGLIGYRSVPCSPSSCSSKNCEVKEACPTVGKARQSCALLKMQQRNLLFFLFLKHQPPAPWLRFLPAVFHDFCPGTMEIGIAIKQKSISLWIKGSLLQKGKDSNKWAQVYLHVCYAPGQLSVTGGATGPTAALLFFELLLL